MFHVPCVSIVVSTLKRSELFEVLSSLVTSSSLTTTPTTVVNASMARLRHEDDRIAGETTIVLYERWGDL
jgi:hypothetical protein